MRAISTTSRRELSSSNFFLQGKVQKEIYAIVTETLACFFPGRVKDLSAPLYTPIRSCHQVFFLKGKAQEEIYAFLTETLPCFLPGRAKDLSASLYTPIRSCHQGFS